MSAISVVELHLQTTDESVLQALNHHQNFMQAEQHPFDPPKPLAVRLPGWQHESAFSDLRCWVVFETHTTRVVGNAWVEASMDTANRHVLDYNILVLPAYRLCGIGRALLTAIVSYAQHEQRFILQTGTSSTVPAGERFMERIGATKGLETYGNQLDLATVDRALIAAWLERSTALEASFRLEFWDGPYPADILVGRSKVSRAMQDTPRGDLSGSMPLPTIQELQEHEQRYAASGITRWGICVRECATNDFVGYTEIELHAAMPTIAEQHDTGVLRAYRQRGIGRWLKAAMIQRVLQERPDVRFIRTNNAIQNAPMLKINHELGFQPYASNAWWEVSLATVSAYVARSQDGDSSSGKSATPSMAS